MRKIPNTDTRYAALKSGEIDGVTDLNAIPPFLAEELKKDSNFVVYKNKSTMVRYLALNGTKKKKNKKKRLCHTDCQHSELLQSGI